MCNFLSLPRELRDQIYELSLVREGRICVIEIDLGMKPFKPELERDIRTTWHGHVNAYRDFGIDRNPMTYQMLPMKMADKPCLNLFLTSRQVYYEGRETYYSQNRFSFGSDTSTSIPALLAFLYDRPLGSLQYIRDLEMCISGTWYFPFWIHFEMSFWEALWDELDRHLSLRCLQLQLCGNFSQLRKALYEGRCTYDTQLKTGSLAFWVREIQSFGKPNCFKFVLGPVRDLSQDSTEAYTMIYENPNRKQMW